MSKVKKPKKKTAPVIQPTYDRDETGPIDVMGNNNQNDLITDEGAAKDNVAEVIKPHRSRPWLVRSLVTFTLLAIITGISWFLWSNLWVPKWAAQGNHDEDHLESSFYESSDASLDLSTVSDSNRQEVIQLQKEIAELQEKREKLLRQERRLQGQLEYLQRQIRKANSRI